MGLRRFWFMLIALSGCAGILWGLSGGASHGWAQTASFFTGSEEKKDIPASGAEWVIDSARLSHDQEQDVYEAEGNVRITSGDRLLEADWVRLDMKTRSAELRGNVHIKYGNDWLRGEHVVWDLEKETGTVVDGLVYFSQNHFYVQGKHITKTGRLEYQLRQGMVTSCDPARPDWKIRYGEMNVDLDGFAVVKHTSFWAWRVPLLYAPIFAVPITRERQSGFLLPWAGFSELNGFEGEIPFYWAIRPDMDATIYGRYMAERGWMTGLEYRINNATWGEGVWLFHYLDDQADREHLLAQGYPFETQHRYWLRSRHSFDLPQEISGRMDLDFVSDRNFLKEFERGSSSWDHSDRVFRELFGRGIINDKTITARESSLLLDKAGDSTLFTFDVRYWDQLDETLNETTLERLPTLSFNTISSRIGQSTLYYSLDSSWVNYWRTEGDRGNRLDIHPRIYYPMHWKTYLDVEPSVGARTTSYAVDWDGRERDAMQNRLLADVRVDMNSRVNRVYKTDFGGLTAVQHAIRPEVSYNYVPEGIDQENIPQFDLLDRDRAQNTIRYGVSNILTTRQVKKDAEGKEIPTYREVTRFQIFQDYHLERPPQDDPLVTETEAGPSAVGLRLDLMPQRYITLTYDTSLYSTESSVGHQDVLMTLDSGQGHSLNFSYQFRDDAPVDELITQTNIKVRPDLYVATYHDYSMDRSELFKHGYGIKYLHGCWALGLYYEEEAEDQRIAFKIDLLGLSTLGVSLSSGSDGESNFGFN